MCCLTADTFEREHASSEIGDGGSVGSTGQERSGRTGLPLVSRPRDTAAADILQRCLRPRVEDPQQPLVRAEAGEEARQGDLPAVRMERGEGPPRVDPVEAARLRSRGAQSLARPAASLGSGPHRSGGGRWRRVWPRELPPALPRMSPQGHARLAGAALDRQRCGFATTTRNQR